MTRKNSFFKSKSSGKYIKKEAVGKSHEVQYFQCKVKNGEDVCAWNVFKIKLQEIGIKYEDAPKVIADIRKVLKRRKLASL